MTEVAVTPAPRVHFIDGADVPSESGGEIVVFNPVTGAVLDRVARGTAAEVDGAVESAAAALPSWRARPPAERAAALRAMGDALAAKADEFAAVEAANGGKTIPNARAEIDASVALLHFYAGVATQNFGRQVPMPDPESLCYTVHEPVGVVAAITPWNYPLQIAVGKIAAALCVGCAVVVKPAPETPLTTIMFARLAVEAGLPAGVLNVVLGDDKTGAALVIHPTIAKITFTGSTEAGRRIASAAGAVGHPVVMELGGKSPNIVFDDVDVDAAIEQILMAGLANSGQECCAGSRILVQDSIVGEFRAAAARWLGTVQIGPGEVDAVVGPLISARQRERVGSLVERALADGAEVVAQAAAPENGFFYPPTILGSVNADMEICTEEIFGPVLTIDTFSDEDDAIAKGNATTYGLAAGVWTADVGRALRCVTRLEAGIVWVNSYLAGDEAAPFGGTKDSGFGREIGVEGALEFTTAKTVYLKAAPTGGAA